jgi:uncharacterized protein (DUF305 family)
MIFALAGLLGLAACGDKTGTADTAGHAHPDHHASPQAETTPSRQPASGTGGGTLQQAMENMMKRMNATPLTNDPDHDFATLMRVHHHGAVEMAKIEARDGQDAELKQLAQKMITAQESEIAAFDRILSSHQPAASNPAASQALMEAMKNMGHGHGTGAESLDHDFADMMIPHHQSAVNMARAYLPHAKNAELKGLAEKIIRDQTVEIGQLQTMMKRFH